MLCDDSAVIRSALARILDADPEIEVVARVPNGQEAVAALRGARVAAVFLAAIPGLTAGIVRAFPPHSAMLPVHVEFDWAVYATIVVSLAAVVVGVRLGGRLDVLVAKRGSSAGETLH